MCVAQSSKKDGQQDQHKLPVCVVMDVAGVDLVVVVVEGSVVVVVVAAVSALLRPLLPSCCFVHLREVQRTEWIFDEVRGSLNPCDSLRRTNGWVDIRLLCVLRLRREPPIVLHIFTQTGSEETTMAEGDGKEPPKPKYVRPKLRSTGTKGPSSKKVGENESEPNNKVHRKDEEEDLRITREKIEKWVKITPSKGNTTPHGSSTGATSSEALPFVRASRSSGQDGDGVHQSENVQNYSGQQATTVTNATQPKGILRKPKYSKDWKKSTAASPSPVHASPVAVKDIVVKDIVEKDPAAAKAAVKQQSIHSGSSTAVEGYEPKTTTTATTPGAPPTTVSSEKNSEPSAADTSKNGAATADDEPVVLSSLADLLERAGTLPSSLDKEDPKVVEADLSFSVMSPQEYEEEKDPTDKEEAHTSTTNEPYPSEKEQQAPEIFQGHYEVFSDGEEESEVMSHSVDPNETDEALMDVLDPAGGDGDHDEYYPNDSADADLIHESLPAPEPRAFMRIWSAMSEWLTPEGVELLNGWKQESKKVDTTGLVTAADAAGSSPSFDVVPPMVDTSDVGASRCAGLMAMINMQLPRCRRELSIPPSQEKLSKQRLAELLRTLNYSRPMPRLDTRMCRVLTEVLLHNVLDLDWDFTANVPESAASVGINKEEYRYLCESAIPSLAAGSA